mgnify:CR=1 FL=1
MGNTPLIRLERMAEKGSAQILVKFEGLNVGGSIKTRTAYNMIRDAEEKGLIQRKSLNGNRRSWHIFLTDRGKEMVEAVDKGFEELEDQAFSGISGEEQESFLKTFEKIYHNMKTLEEKKHDRKN